MAEAVVEAIAAAARHHQAGRLQQLGREPLHLLQMAEQPIPALRRIAKAKALERAFAQPPLLAQIGQGAGTLRAAQLAAEPAGSQGESLMQLIAA